MTWLYAVESMLLLSAAIAGWLAWYGWRQGANFGNRYFAWLMIAVAEYSLTVALELSCTSIPAKIFWSKIQFVGAASLTPLWLFVALSHGPSNHWLKQRWVLLIWVLPAVAVLLTVTNEWHGLIWSNVRPVTNSMGHLVIYEHGPAFKLSMVFCYAMMLVASLYLIGVAFRSPRLHRAQVLTLLAASLAPWIVNAISMAGLNPMVGLEHAQFAFTLTGVFLVWNIYRNGMLRIAPMAYEAVLGAMNEGVVLIDAHGRIADINRAAERILGLHREARGKPAATALTPWPSLAQLKAGRIELERHSPDEPQNNAQWIEANLSPLQDSGGQPIGSLLVVQEITERKQAAHHLDKLRTALAARVKELEDSAIHIRMLQGIIPICMHCKRIRDDQQSWQQVEKYIQQHSEAQFSHGLCPDCLAKYYPDTLHETH